VGVQIGIGRVVRLRGVRVIAVVLLALASGCSHTPAGLGRRVGLGGGPGSGTIVWLAGPQADTASDDVRQVLADAFEQAYPSIKVKLITGPDSTDRLRSTLVQELSGRDVTPDVYSGDVVWPYGFARDGLALPLSKYLPASFWARFGSSGTQGAGAMVHAMTYRGAIYAVPYFIDEGFLFYRKDLLARAGLKPPTTWEQLVLDSEVLKHKGLPYQFVWQGNNYEGLTCDWYEILADAFGELPAHANPAAELDSPQALKALDFLRSLIIGGVSPRDIDTFEEPEADNAFDSGHAAFLRGWDSSYTNAMSATSVIADPRKVGVELPPAFQGQRGPGWSVMGGWGLFVNPRTRNLRADLTFVTWMSGVQAQRILASQYWQIPTNASVRTDPSIIDTSPVLQAATRARLASRPSGTTDYQQITDAIHENIYAALPGPSSDGRDPCQALIHAARAIDPHVHGTLRCPGPATVQG
jgi:multiple sugar transport system substrate-binding protein